MIHPTVVAIWKRWIREDVICSTWTANTVYPGFDRIGWHADYPYWSITPPWPSGRLTGQTLWMLDDFTEENGATGVVPCSHLKLSPPENGDVWHEDIVIVMYYREHGVPHFHAKYAGQTAVFSIANLKLIEGELPKRVIHLVLEWAFDHRGKLMENWSRATERRPMEPIYPIQ